MAPRNGWMWREEKRGMDMAKLIAFYSRAGENYFGGQYRTVAVGNTEKVANQIAEVTGGTLFKIRQIHSYAADYKSCIRQAKADQRAKARPQLAEPLESLDLYEEIFLGYPNYWGDMPMAVYTFLESFDWTGKIIHPFCTHEGQRLKRNRAENRRRLQGGPRNSGAGHPGVRCGCRRRYCAGVGTESPAVREENLPVKNVMIWTGAGPDRHGHCPADGLWNENR